MVRVAIIDTLFETGIQHLYQAEQEVYKTLETMAEKSQSSYLKKLFEHHHEETKHQIERLEQVISLLDIDHQSNKSLAEAGKELLNTMLDANFTGKSKGMAGILGEGKELMRHFLKTDAADLALISAGDMVENFEIGCYVPLCLIAENLGEKEVLKLLETSLNEEREMEKKIMKFAREEKSLFKKE